MSSSSSATGQPPRWSPPTANPSNGSARWPTPCSPNPRSTVCSPPPMNSSWRESPIAAGRNPGWPSAPPPPDPDVGTALDHHQNNPSPTVTPPALRYRYDDLPSLSQPVHPLRPAAI